MLDQKGALKKVGPCWKQTGSYSISYSLIVYQKSLSGKVHDGEDLQYDWLNVNMFYGVPS